MLKAYSKFLDIIELILKWFICIAGITMVAVITYQVILRYCFHQSNVWSEELARYLFAYIVLLGAVIATRRQSQLQIDFLINLWKPKIRHLITAVCTLLGMIFLFYLLKYSIILCQGSFRNTSAGMRIPFAYIYMCLPIGSFLMILTSIEVVAKNIADFLNYDEGSNGKEVAK